MVGVPGKSKGCSTCRRRKKGCDQKRPICGQCTSSGYFCGGYQRELSFIIHPASKSVEKAFFLRHKNQSRDLAFAFSLNRASLDSQCRALFWDLYLPRGVVEVHNNMLSRCKHPPNWTSVLPELPPTEPCLDLAISALSISRVGRDNNDLRLVKESTKIYGRALKDLQKALCDDSRVQTTEVLAACSVLGLYETFEGGDPMSRSVGWMAHAAGAARLIEVRGPYEHVDRQPHHIFLGARLPTLFSALLRRKKTFLARQEWLSIPWQAMPCKTPHDALVDLAVSLPGLLEDFDILSSSSDSRVGLQDLLESFKKLEDAITTWERNKKQFARPVSIPHEQSEGDLYPFAQEMSWDNHIFFNSSLVYWAVQLVLSTTITQIEVLLSFLDCAAKTWRTSTTSNQDPARQYASCIIQSIPYALMPDMGALGITHIVVPLCLAFQYFTHAGEEQICAWLTDVCDNLRCQGVQLRPFVDPLKAGPNLEALCLDQMSGKMGTEKVTGPASPHINHDRGAHGKFPPSPADVDTSRSITSIFIYENPAKYYDYSLEPE